MSENEMLKMILDKVSNLDTTVSGLETVIKEVQQDVSSLKSDVSSLKSDVGSLKSDVGSLELDMQEVKQKVGSLESDMQEVKQKVTKIDLTLDNEIRVNIQRVAEGHLDLSRNLQDVMRPNNEIEMLAIKVRMLESDVRELKYKIL